jgi:hypothetical protein
LFALPQFWVDYHFHTAMLDEEGNDCPDYRLFLPANKVLELPLPDGYRLCLDFAQDSRLEIRSAHLPEPVVLGVSAGHFALPALRWEEIALLESRLGERWRGPFPFRYLPLLLDRMACFTEGDDLESVSRKWWADWRAAEVMGDEDLDIYAGYAPGSILKPLTGIRWRRDPRYGWVCTGPQSLSLRNPGEHLLFPDPQFDMDFYFRQIEAFFAVVAEGWGGEA